MWKVQTLERKDTGVVGDTAVLLERGLHLLVQLVRFAGLGDGTNAKLSREVVFLPDGVVDDGLDGVLARRTLLKAGGSDFIAGGIEGFHCIEEPL